VEENANKLHFLIASPLPLLFIHKFGHFWCLKEESFPTLIANKIFHINVLLLFSLLRSVCGTGNSSQQTSLQCLSTINMVFSDEDKILIKSLHLKGYTAKRLTDKFLEKSWTKRGVSKLLKKLRDTEPPNTTTQQLALFRATRILLQKITMPLYAEIF